MPQTTAAVRLKIAPMPAHTTPAKLYAASVVAGLGFTVALFIANLAYPDAPERPTEAKLGTACGSVLAGVVGGPGSSPSFDGDARASSPFLSTLVDTMLGY